MATIHLPKFLRVILYIFGGLIIFFVILYLLLRMPQVQTFVTQKITDQLSEQLGTTVRVKGVDIDFVKKVVLEGIYVEDQQQDTLLYAEKLRVDVGLFALLGKKIVLDEILLENAYANLYTVDDSATLNFAFIPEAFADTTQQDTTEAGWEFDLKDIILSHFRMDYKDHTTPMQMGLAVPSLEVNLRTLGLNESHIQAKEIHIDGLDFRFYQLAEVAPQDTTATFEDTSSSAPLNPSGFNFSVNRLLVDNSHVAFITDTTSTYSQINFGNLDLAQLHIDIEDIEVGENSILASIKKTAFEENNSRFALKDLALNLTLEMPSVKAELTALATNQSELAGQINLSLPDINSPDSLLSLLMLKADLDKLEVGLADASFFTDALDAMPELKAMKLGISGNIAVENSNAHVQNFALRSGEEASIEANALVQGIDDFGNAYMNIDLKAFIANFDFVAKLLPPQSLPPTLQKAGSVNFMVQGEGYLNDADLIANLASDIGRVSANINFKAQNEQNFNIQGEANAFRLDLNTITGNDSLGITNLNTRFIANMQNGSLSADTLTLTVKDFYFNHYHYQDLQLNASLKDSTLISTIGYDDNNLKLDILAKANLKKDNSWLVLTGDVPKVDLLKLRLSPDSIIVQTTMEADLHHLDPDQINGFFRLANTTLIDGANKYLLDTFQIKASSTDTLKSFSLASDFMEATLKGRFSFEALPLMVNNFMAHYFTGVEDTSAHIDDHYMELQVDIREEPIVMRAFLPQISLPESSTISGSYYADNNMLNLNVDIPMVIFEDYQVQSLHLGADTKQDNLKFGLNTDHILIGENMTIPNLAIEGSFIQDMIQFNVSLANSEAPSHLDFNGFITNRNDTIILEILDSYLSIEKNEWQISNNAVITYADSFLMVNNFFFEQGNQRISIQTHDEATESALLDLEIKNLEIGNIFTILDMEAYGINGTLDGTAHVVNVFALEQVEADLGIENLVINDQAIGALRVQAEKPLGDVPLQAHVSMDGADNQFTLEGTFAPEDSVDNLSLQLLVSKFRLDQWEVFVEEHVTDLKGNLTADISIGGSPTQPVIEGYLAFDPESQLRATAIGSLFRFDDQRIEISESSIDLNNFVIRDSANHVLNINGQVRHQYFQDFDLDLSVQTDEFKFFNARQRYSPAFYGTINAATDITIKGPIEDLTINGSITTKKGTHPVIALVDDPDIATHAAFINFVNTNAYLAADSIPDTVQVRDNTVQITGMSIQLVLHITSDAITEILIDPVSGDKLLAVGEGDIMVQMTPTGDMNIQGTYILEEGSYSLSFMNILKKEFQIREGSTIQMAGDPLGAQFGITAIYSTEASASNLYPAQATTAGATSSQINTKQPVNVVLKLNGTLEEPEVAFAIELPAISDPNNEIAQRIKMIENDQSQLYQQVFGLIVLNRFIPTDGGLGSGGGGGAAAMINQRVDASVSGILTAQLSRLTQDYLGGVELSVDLESRNENETSFENKDVQVQLTKQFLNDRLTVSVGGTSSLGQDQSSPNASSTPLMGDFEILYRINESGTLNMRIFQSNTRDIFTQEIRERQGTSLTWVKSFDEIFMSKKDKKILRAE